MKGKAKTQDRSDDLMEALGSILDNQEAEPPTAIRQKPLPLRSKLRAGQTPDDAVAEMAVDGLAMNAVATLKFSSTLTADNADLTEIFVRVAKSAEAIKRGDHSSAEGILSAQIVSLNAIYTDLATTAAVNLSRLDTFERLMRLAFRAQAQCRSAAESLAFIRNPGGAVFAKQANIAHGPQQVNNGPAPHARTEQPQSRPNELKRIEAAHEPMDTGAAREAVETDSPMATVGARHRATKRRG